MILFGAKMIELNKKSNSPPSPQLQPGHLLNKEIEIMNILTTDHKKNVYYGLLDIESVIILEQYNQQNNKKKKNKIPKECERFFPIFLNSFNTNEREYIVFQSVNGSSLHSNALNCWEPDLASLLYKIILSLVMLDKYKIKISDISLKDIYVSTNVQFLIFPKAKTGKQKIGHVIKELIKQIFYKKIQPNLTRDLENPLNSLCLSKRFENIIINYITGKLDIKNLVLNLKQIVDTNYPNWLVYSKTDVGLARDHNEDSCGWISSFSTTCFNEDTYFALAVSDGMGGHQKGEIASHLALTSWFQNIHNKFSEIKNKNYTNPMLMTLIGDSFDYTSKKLLESEEFRKFSSDSRPGATLVAAIVIDRMVFIGNCGDSRAYIICQNSIKKITSDHSLVQLYIERGEVTEKEAKNHEKSNYITTFVGIEPKNFKKDIYVRYLPQGAILLLCSDGLTGMLDDQEILNIVSSSFTPKEGVQNLIKEANKKGGEDNISIILMKDIQNG